jgi:adenylate cyclase
VRITCQLIEAANGGHIWADRFDGDLADIFELQDRITETVVGAIEPSLRRAEIARAAAKPTDSLDAYDLFLRAVPLVHGLTWHGLNSAIALLRQALTIDPDYTRAKALLASVHTIRIDQQWGEPGDGEKALALARETIATGTDDPEALRLAGFALVYGGDRSGALTVLNRALRLHPGSAHVLSYLGFAYILGNAPEAAIPHLEHAMRVSPLDPEIGNMLGGLGGAFLLLGRDAEALPLLRRAVDEMPNAAWIHRHLILALTRAGKPEEARAAAARLLRVSPGHRIGPMQGETFNPAYNQERRQALLDAGIPE